MIRMLHRHRRTIPGTLLIAAVVGAGWAAAGAAELRDEPWSERRFGVSLQPPRDAELAEHAGEDHLLRVRDLQEQYTMTLAARQTSATLSLDTVAATAQREMRELQPSMQVVEHQRELTAGTLAAQRLYYRVPHVSGQDVLIGQLIVMVHARLYVVLEVTGAMPHEQRVRRVFEAVGATIRVEDQQALAERRRKAVEAGMHWFTDLTADQLRAATHGPRYFRIIEDDRDIGYVRTTCEAGQFAGLPGIQYVVQMHVEQGTGAVDSRAEYFRPFDAVVGEAWTVRTTMRGPGGQGQPAARTALETAAGTSDGIQVRIEGTAGLRNDHHEFPRPPQGYLPQVDARLLGRLLPHDAAGEYGFYWYNRSTREMTFRLDRLTPTIDGFVITTRSGPNAAPRRATYDAGGNLIEQDLGGGRSLKRTNLQSLKTLWRMR